MMESNQPPLWSHVEASARGGPEAGESGHFGHLKGAEFPLEVAWLLQQEHLRDIQQKRARDARADVLRAENVLKSPCQTRSVFHPIEARRAHLCSH